MNIIVSLGKNGLWKNKMSFLKAKISIDSHGTGQSAEQVASHLPSCEVSPSQEEKRTVPSFFRSEMFNDIKNKNYGTVSINVPVKYTVLTSSICSLMVLIILFFIFADYSEKFIVKGFINSTRGIVRVYPNKNGVIVKSWIHQGTQVKKGDTLFLVDTSYDGLSKHGKHAVFDQLTKRYELIEKDINYKKKHLTTLKNLLEKKYIALDLYNQKREELNALIVTKNTIEMDLIKYKQERSYLIRAPIDGVVASVIYQQGQNVNLSKPVLKIIPNNADLIAELFIPVNKSGFLNKKNQVIIRYDAYPSERFGTANGVITDISQSILTDDEDEKPLRIGQPYYKATIKLDTPFVIIYGKQKRIQHGMTLSAVIVGSKKKIWKWVLDPLYSYYGELFV